MEDFYRLLEELKLNSNDPKLLSELRSCINRKLGSKYLYPEIPIEEILSKIVYPLPGFLSVESVSRLEKEQYGNISLRTSIKLDYTVTGLRDDRHRPGEKITITSRGGFTDFFGLVLHSNYKIDSETSEPFDISNKIVEHSFTDNRYSDGPEYYKDISSVNYLASEVCTVEQWVKGIQESIRTLNTAFNCIYTR